MGQLANEIIFIQVVIGIKKQYRTLSPKRRHEVPFEMPLGI